MVDDQRVWFLDAIIVPWSNYRTAHLLTCYMRKTPSYLNIKQFPGGPLGIWLTPVLSGGAKKQAQTCTETSITTWFTTELALTHPWEKEFLLIDCPETKNYLRGKFRHLQAIHWDRAVDILEDNPGVYTCEPLGSKVFLKQDTVRVNQGRKDG